MSPFTVFAAHAECSFPGVFVPITRYTIDLYRSDVQKERALVQTLSLKIH